MQKKLIRITTIPLSLKVLLKGQLNFISGYYDVIAVSSSGDELKEVEENEGVRVVSIEMTRSISPFRDIVSILKLFILFKKESPYIVHSHTPKAGFVAMSAAILAGVPHRIHTVAGLPLMEATGIKRRILLFVEKITYKMSEFVLPNSIGLRDFILENNLIEKNKLKILGNGSSNGINLNFFKTSESLAKQSQELKNEYCINERFIYLFIGRIVSHKGITELVESFLLLNKKYPQTLLLIVGDFESQLDPLPADTLLKLNNQAILLLGYHKDVRVFLEMADVFVFPSYREGFPNVVLQACAFNLPCIVSNISGCNEIIVNNENGFLVPVKSVSKLYESMALLYADQNLRGRLGQSNRQLIENRFDQKFVWENILNFYNSL